MKLSEVITYNGGKGDLDGNNYWKKHRVPRYIYIFTMLVLMGICIGLVSLFVCSSYLGNEDWAMFLSYLREPLILLLNLLPCVLLVLLFYFATGRAWAAFTFPALLIFILSLINYYKIRIRNEPFLASDISLAGEAAGIISNYTLDVTGRVLLLIGCFVFGVLFAVFLMRGSLKNKWARIIGSVLSAGALAALFFTVYISPTVYNTATNETAEYNRWSELQVYVSKGFVYPFLHSVPDAFPKPPEGYDEDDAAELLGAYQDEGINESKKVNLIAVMLEAYTDLSEHPEVPLSQDVYGPLHELEKESLSGHIIANVFGGGTVDTERNFLTGYTVSEDYRVATNSYVYYLRQQGYYAEGFHTGDDWFYNRENVEKYLGMEEYYFLQDYDSADRSDEFFFSVLAELYNSRDKDTPYFNFSVTYQNHGAYDATGTGEESFVLRDGLTDGTYNILNNYLTGIADTTQRMYDFIDSFRESDEPVVIVFFGDHMPWLGDGNSVYAELGINIDLGTEEGFYNYYSTPYIIWANDAAKAATGGSFTGDGGDMSSCFLMDRIFTECGWGRSAYMQLNHRLYELTNIVSSSSGYYNIDGQLTKDPGGDAGELIRELQFAEYYMKNEFMYDGLYGGG